MDMVSSHKDSSFARIDCRTLDRIAETAVPEQYRPDVGLSLRPVVVKSLLRKYRPKLRSNLQISQLEQFLSASCPSLCTNRRASLALLKSAPIQGAHA